jgi:hypothetical protein
VLERLRLGAQPPHFARRLRDGLELGIFLGDLDEFVARQLAGRHLRLQLVAPRFDRGDAVGGDGGHGRAFQPNASNAGHRYQRRGCALDVFLDESLPFPIRARTIFNTVANSGTSAFTGTSKSNSNAPDALARSNTPLHVASRTCPH